jgi:hypothetical protein
MTSFTSTSSTTHSSTISGLHNGNSYFYYIKCSDNYNNINSDDYLISFSVPSNAGGSGGLTTNYVLLSTTTPIITLPTTALTTASPTPTLITISIISGCDSRTNGFSVTTGVSCVGNTGTDTTGSTSLPQTIYNLGLVTLRLWSQGETVKELQRLLNRAFNLDLTIDGILGPKTITIVKKWQKNHGLKVDGLIGVKTKAFMNAMVR